MQADFINPFISAAVEVLQKETGAEVKRGEISLEKSAYTSHDVTVLIGVTGMLQGLVLYGFPEATAKNIVEAILGERVAVLDEMVVSAMAEMGNVITGLASGGLEAKGYICDITPPSVIIGRGVVLSTIKIHRLRIPLITSLGLMEISCAFTSTASATS